MSEQITLDRNTILLISALSAIIAAVIGSAFGLLTTYLQLRAEHRNRIATLAVEAGIADHKQLIENAALRSRSAGGATVIVPPMISSLTYHYEALKLLDQNNLTPQTLSEVAAHTKSFNEVFDSD